MSKEDKIGLGIIIGFVVVMLVFAVVQPYFEARTFNKFSSTKATYLDALVSQLRVLPDGR